MNLKDMPMMSWNEQQQAWLPDGPMPTPDEVMGAAQEVIDAMPESDEKIAAQMMHDELVSRRERTTNG